MSPGELVQAIKDSDLRGRGGAGFPTGMKWASMLPIEESARPRYIACNFDEMEPGTFKDRFLVEGDPHQLIEGIVIAGHCVPGGCGLYLRAGRVLSRNRDPRTSACGGG